MIELTAAKGSTMFTMSMASMQSAELTDKRQDNIKVVMDDLKEQGVISFTEIQENPSGVLGGRPIKVYYVSERDSHVVVARVSVAYTGVILPTTIGH
jgi:predicted transcriptional regulator